MTFIDPCDIRVQANPWSNINRAVRQQYVYFQNNKMAKNLSHRAKWIPNITNDSALQSQFTFKLKKFIRVDMKVPYHL